MTDSNDSSYGSNSMIGLFWTLVALYGIYLSFKCNKGIDIMGLLGALFFGPVYVAYKLGTDMDGCYPPKNKSP
tara:strand:+ start:2777 stop:2995 length:219 start_codon:yes stop_codon:yes gene_type:complete